MDKLWAEVRDGVIVWVSANRADAVAHNLNPGCKAVEYVEAKHIHVLLQSMWEELERE